MAGVSLHNVTKNYEGHKVLHGVSLDAKDGEFIILVGPSGCGKSTLLRMIAGLEEISGGEVRIGPKVVNHLAPKERDIAMVFQSYALYPHMTIAQNMAFSLEMSKVGKADIDRQVRAAAEILDLGQLLERFPRQLSGGQRQRVAMGRAIVRNPKVFLFDEPLSNLDAKLRVAMRAEIKALHHKLKSTIIYVTHDQIEAMTMADRIVVMNAGRIEQVGTPLDLYDNPTNKFVAAFIGSPAMNFFPGTIESDANGVCVRLSDGTLWPVMDLRGKARTSGQVDCGVRPEHFSVATQKDPCAIKTEVIVVEPTGAETHVNLRHGTFEFTAVLRERITAAPGDTIYLQPDLAQARVFDSASGLRI